MEVDENLHMFHDDEEVGGGSEFLVECPYKKMRLDCNAEDTSFVTTFEKNSNGSNSDDNGNQSQQEVAADYENLEDMVEGEAEESENGETILAFMMISK